VKSPFSGFTGSAVTGWAAEAPGSAGLPRPPEVVPAGTSPPADWASALVAADTGAPSSSYGCPLAPSGHRLAAARDLGCHKMPGCGPVPVGAPRATACHLASRSRPASQDQVSGSVAARW
jgi:hypothetical protein